MVFFGLSMTLLLIVGCETQAVPLIIEDNLDPYSGWVDYVNNDYNDTRRLILGANVLYNITFDNYTTRTTQLPLDLTVDDLFNGTHISGRNGDAILFSPRQWMDPLAANAECEVFINIGGSVGQLITRDLTFPKGSSVDVPVKFTSAEYQLNTWEANGGQIQYLCTQDTEIWNMSIVIFRIHKGR